MSLNNNWKKNICCLSLSSNTELFNLFLYLKSLQQDIGGSSLISFFFVHYRKHSLTVLSLKKVTL